jgi:hypothetical protein
MWKVTGGDSLGHARASHNSKAAVRKLTSIDSDDRRKSIDVAAKMWTARRGRWSRRVSIPVSASAKIFQATEGRRPVPTHGGALRDEPCASPAFLARTSR